MNYYLATYRDGQDWTFSWFATERAAMDWLNYESDGFEEIDIIELKVVRQLIKDGVE